MSIPTQTVAAWPAHGDLIMGRDAAGRVLRINGHPESDRVVLSIWQGPRCVATVRLTPSDVPDVIAALVRSVLPETPSELPGHGASVSPLRPPAEKTMPADTGPAAAPDRFGAAVHRLRKRTSAVLASIGARIGPPPPR